MIQRSALVEETLMDVSIRVSVSGGPKETLIDKSIDSRSLQPQPLRNAIIGLFNG